MGGNAFGHLTRRINKDEILETLSWLEDKWPSHSKSPIPLSERLLGSAGKKETSGDLDLNIDKEIYVFDEVLDELKTFVPENLMNVRRGNNQIFTAIPIKGSPGLGYVQVDFMFGKYDWQTFSYYSPGDYCPSDPHTSKYKGLFRTELLKALVTFKSDWISKESGEVIARAGPTFFHDVGIVWRYRHRPIRKDKSGRIKSFKILSKSEFSNEFPLAYLPKRENIDDPDKAVAFMLDSSYGPEDCTTYERIWEIVETIYNLDEQELISKLYLERLNSLKVSIPAEILERHSRNKAEETVNALERNSK